MSKPVIPTTTGTVPGNAHVHPVVRGILETLLGVSVAVESHLAEADTATSPLASRGDSSKDLADGYDLATLVPDKLSRIPSVRGTWSATLDRRVRLAATSATEAEANEKKPAGEKLRGRDILAELNTGYRTPHRGKKITGIQAIVTHNIKKSGLTIEIPAENPGERPVRVYVYTRDDPRTLDWLKPGAGVKIKSAVVSPFRGQTPRDAGNLDSPQISCRLEDLESVAAAQTLAEPEIIGEGGSTPPKDIIGADDLRVMKDDLKTDSLEEPGVPFNTETSANAWFRSRIGQDLKIKNALVVGASDDRRYFYVVPDGGKGAANLSERGTVVYTEGNYPTNVIRIDVAGLAPEAKAVVTVGDRIEGDITGTLEYSYGEYQLRLHEPFTVKRGGLKPQLAKVEDRAKRFYWGNGNVENFSAKDEARARELAFDILVYQRAPDVYGLQEIQDNNGKNDDGTVAADKTLDLLISEMHALFARIRSGDVSELKAHGLDDDEIKEVVATLPEKLAYEAVQIDPEDGADGGIPGGNIRVAALVNTSLVGFARRGDAGARTETKVAGKKDEPHLSHNPGRIAPLSEAFHASRKPMVFEVSVGDETYFFIIPHLMSKRGDSDPWDAFQPPHTPTEDPRAAQVRELREFADKLLEKNPKARIVVMGDMNEFHFNKPMRDMTEGGGLVHVPSALLTGAEIYSYVHGGRAQALDQMFVSAELMAAGITFQFWHGNTEFPSVREPRGSASDAGGPTRDADGRKSHPVVVSADGGGVRVQRSDHDAMLASAPFRP